MNGLDVLTIDDFMPLLGTRFFLPVGDLVVWMRLIEVTPDHRRSPSGAGRDPFHLAFQGPAQPLLPQGTYHFSTEDGVTLSMFLVPVDQVDGGIVYQVVYN